jgi:hypothetical protein
LLTHFGGDGAAALAVLDPEIADTGIGVAQGEAIVGLVQKKGSKYQEEN